MLALGAVVLLLGYNNLYFGLDQLRGGNNGWFSLLVPGKFKMQPTDKQRDAAAAAGAPASVLGDLGALGSWIAQHAP